jgi:hypothetical protein
MKTVQMSLATIQGKLSRAEMKNIMAGCNCKPCKSQSDCPGQMCANWIGSGPCGAGQYCS